MTVKRVILTSIGSLILAIGLAYIYRWHVVIFSLIPWLVVPTSLVLVLFGLAVRQQAKVKGTPRLHTFGDILLLLSLMFVVQLAAPRVARAFWNWEIQRTQTFLGTLIPKLDEYKRQYGDYPETVAPLLELDASLPDLLKLTGEPPFAFDNRAFYRRSGSTYSFEFYVPDGFIGYQYHYCCGADGTWTVTD